MMVRTRSNFTLGRPTERKSSGTSRGTPASRSMEMTTTASPPPLPKITSTTRATSTSSPPSPRPGRGPPLPKTTKTMKTASPVASRLTTKTTTTSRPSTRSSPASPRWSSRPSAARAEVARRDRPSQTPRASPSAFHRPPIDSIPSGTMGRTTMPTPSSPRHPGGVTIPTSTRIISRPGPALTVPIRRAVAPRGTATRPCRNRTPRSTGGSEAATTS
mmetsp:Transcript_48802/g.147041  ORF Transcript_48802/g.147041 Transcript_48802/m.147041 type:complete len:217 (-) Transcript_48802:518-1168(-)